jgi:hypothetical protein
VYAAVVQQCQEARDTMSEARTLQSYETEEQQPGRVEIRRPWTLAVPPDLVPQDPWAQLRCLGRVESEPHLKGAVTIEQRYSIASLPNDVQQFAHAVAFIGELSIVSTGFSMWPFGQRTPGSGWAMAQKISPCCAIGRVLKLLRLCVRRARQTQSDSQRGQ